MQVQAGATNVYKITSAIISVQYKLQTCMLINNHVPFDPL
jgi:hypothetical protein